MIGAFDMSKLTSRIFTLVFVVVAAVNGITVASWAGNAMKPADLVAAGKQWNVLLIETDKDGFRDVTFLPAGQTPDEAFETLTFSYAIEEVPSSAYDGKAALDESLSNAKHYKSHVEPKDNSARAHGLYSKVPGRHYAQLFSLKAAYMDNGKTFVGATYRVNANPNSELATQPAEAFGIMDQRVSKISPQQIADWFKHHFENAQKNLAAQKTAAATKS